MIPFSRNLRLLLSQTQPVMPATPRFMIFKKNIETPDPDSPASRVEAQVRPPAIEEATAVIVLLASEDSNFCQKLKNFMNSQEWIEAEKLPPANHLDAYKNISIRQYNPSLSRDALPVFGEEEYPFPNHTPSKNGKKDFLNPGYPYLREINHEIELHLADENFRPVCLAKKMFLCEMQLHRKLKKLSGLSPANYIRKYRLHRSLTFLKDRRLSISDTCFKVGFRSLEYYSRCFKQEFGICPSKYRP
jgi:AraC-like DNA-binding protein